MLYVSGQKGTKVVISNSETNDSKTYEITDLGNIFKKNNVAVGGLSYTPKKGIPKVEVTTPLLICLDSLTVGSPCKLKLDKKKDYIQCIKLKSTEKKQYKFFDGNTKDGCFLINRDYFIKNKNDCMIDIMSVDYNTVATLKKLLKEKS